MSCEERANKYPYVYECCPDSLDGITTEFLKNLFSHKDVEGFHIICCACRRVYHIYKLGMKWTEEVATDDDIKEYKEKKVQYELNKHGDLKEDTKEIFTLDDVDKFRCKVCKKGMFENESFEMKKEFIDSLNGTIGIVMKVVGPIVSKEDYIKAWNATDLTTNSCRRCFVLGKQRIGLGKYN